MANGLIPDFPITTAAVSLAEPQRCLDRCNQVTLLTFPDVPWSCVLYQNRSCGSCRSDPMQHDPKSNHSLWRGLIGCIVAYALFINGFLSGVLGAEWVAQAAAGLIGEHCLTDARAAAPDPAPAGQPDDSSHCAVCTLAAAPVVLPAEPPSARSVPPRASTPSGTHDRDLTLWPGDYCKLPRGPPQRS